MSGGTTTQSLFYVFSALGCRPLGFGSNCGHPQRLVIAPGFGRADVLVKDTQNAMLISLKNVRGTATGHVFIVAAAVRQYLTGLKVKCVTGNGHVLIHDLHFNLANLRIESILK